MADYIQFVSADGSTILVEVDEGEISSTKAIQKAGLREIASKQIAIAQNSFQDAIEQAISHNAEAFIQVISGLAVLPHEAEITFGLKITGEAGNVAVGKIGGEANYTIKLTWQRETKDKE